MISRRTLLVALLMLCTAFMACRKSALVYDTPPRDIPAVSERKLSLDEVKAAIIRGANSRGWTIESQAPGVITANIVMRNKHSATVDICYTETSFDIKYRDSSNLKYNPQTKTIHPNYDRWVSYLSDSISRELRNASQLPSAQLPPEQSPPAQ